MKSFFRIFNSLFVLYCTVTVYYFILYRYLAELSIIRIIQIFLLVWTVFQVASGILQRSMYPKIKEKKQSVQPQKLIDILLVFLHKIISDIFYVYTFIFVVFGLYMKSFVFTYIMIAIHSLFLGYWLAIYVEYSLRDKNNLTNVN